MEKRGTYKRKPIREEKRPCVELHHARNRFIELTGIHPDDPSLANLPSMVLSLTLENLFLHLIKYLRPAQPLLKSIRKISDAMEKAGNARVKTMAKSVVAKLGDKKGAPDLPESLMCVAELEGIARSLVFIEKLLQISERTQPESNSKSGPPMDLDSNFMIVTLDELLIGKIKEPICPEAIACMAVLLGLEAEGQDYESFVRRWRERVGMVRGQRDTNAGDRWRDLSAVMQKIRNSVEEKFKRKVEAEVRGMPKNDPQHE